MALSMPIGDSANLLCQVTIRSYYVQALVDVGNQRIDEPEPLEESTLDEIPY